MTLSNSGKRRQSFTIHNYQTKSSNNLHLMLPFAGHSKQVELDSHLSRILPSNLTKYFYCNSGSEAVDNAVKIARVVTGRQGIIAFDVSCGGQS